MSDRTMFHTGHIRPRWPRYQHVRAADRMIDEVRRRVERRERWKATAVLWGERFLVGSAVVVVPGLFWWAALTLAMAVWP